MHDRLVCRSRSRTRDDRPIGPTTPVQGTPSSKIQVKPRTTDWLPGCLPVRTEPSRAELKPTVGHHRLRRGSRVKSFSPALSLVGLSFACRLAKETPVSIASARHFKLSATMAQPAPDCKQPGLQKAATTTCCCSKAGRCTVDPRPGEARLHEPAGLSTGPAPSSSHATRLCLRFVFALPSRARASELHPSSPLPYSVDVGQTKT